MRISVLLAAGCLSACSCSSTTSRGCTRSTDCGEGRGCLDGRCTLSSPDTGMPDTGPDVGADTDRPDVPDMMRGEHYPDYRDFLRFESAKFFVWITDDESPAPRSEGQFGFTADSFRASLSALEPMGMFDIQFHNAIVGFYGDAPSGWADPDAGSCGGLARVGTTYLQLANCLDDSNMPIADCMSGRQERVCETDWTPIFESIAEGVLAGVPVQCDFEVPPAPEGMRINVDEVDVEDLRVARAEVRLRVKRARMSGILASCIFELG